MKSSYKLKNVVATQFFDEYFKKEENNDNNNNVEPQQQTKQQCQQQYLQFVSEQQLKQNQFVIKKIPSNSQSLFNAISHAIFFTSGFCEEIKAAIFGYFIQLLKENEELPCQLQELKENYLLLQDFINHQHLKKFDQKNLVLAANMIELNIKVYYLNTNTHQLENDNYLFKDGSKKVLSISLFRNESGDYNPLFSTTRYKYEQQLQSFKEKGQQFWESYQEKLYQYNAKESSLSKQEYEKWFQEGQKQENILKPRLINDSDVKIYKQISNPVIENMLFNNNVEEVFQQDNMSQNFFKDIISYTAQFHEHCQEPNNNKSQNDNSCQKSPLQKAKGQFKNFGLGLDVRQKSQTTQNPYGGTTQKVNKVIQVEEDDTRYEGKLKFFDEKKQFGFFVFNKDQKDIFVHQDDLEKAGVTLEQLKTYKGDNQLNVSFKAMTYVGKKGTSKKAVDIIKL